MKYNRIGLLFVMLFAIMTLCGCLDVKNMTEEEADMVAEYSAGVLLRYSDTYEWRLITKEQREKAGEEPTAVPVATSSPSEPPKATGTGEGSTTDTDTPAVAPSEPDSPVMQEVALDDIYRLDGVSVRFKNAQICSTYKNIQVPAGNKERLLVVTFELHNKSSKTKTVNLMKRNIEYPLVINGETYQLGINLLKGNDLKYLDTKIKPGKTEKAVLIYNIPESVAKRGSRANVTVREAGSDKQATYDMNIG